MQFLLLEIVCDISYFFVSFDALLMCLTFPVAVFRIILSSLWIHSDDDNLYLTLSSWFQFYARTFEWRVDYNVGLRVEDRAHNRCFL